MKMRKKRKGGDFTTVYVLLLTILVIALIALVGYAARTSKLPGINKSVDQRTTVEPSIRPNPYSPEALQQSQQKLPAVTYKSIFGGDRVKYKIDNFKKLALQPLEFEVFDEAKKPYRPDDLKSARGYKMHYIVVSANLNEFQHLYPIYEKGKWKVLTNLPTSGVYYAFVDITPVNGKPLVLRTRLFVQSNAPAKNFSFPIITPDLISKANGYEAKLTISPFRLFAVNVFSFVLKKSENVVKNFQAYLDTFGDLVIFRQGDLDSFFMYAQPLSSDAARGLIEFSATLILPGRYTAFAEFKIGGRVVTFPVTFDVE